MPAAVDNIRILGGDDLSATGNDLDNTLFSGSGNNVLNGGSGGRDTVSYAFAGSAVQVSLATAGAQATGGSGSDVLNGIENLAGSDFNDELTGDSGGNVLDGGAGDDVIEGGNGVDQAVYGSTQSSANVTATVTGCIVTSALGGTDTLASIERLKFSDVSIARDLGVTQSAGATALLVGAVLPGTLALDPSKQALLGSVIDLFDAGFRCATSRVLPCGSPSGTY
ncbi:MAG: hypothetical protein IPO43_15420 [Rhodoferax sp.]|nr:hypothetical protein [Rhodoferax sp.]